MRFEIAQVLLLVLLLLMLMLLVLALVLLLVLLLVVFLLAVVPLLEPSWGVGEEEEGRRRSRNAARGG